MVIHFDESGGTTVFSAAKIRGSICLNRCLYLSVIGMLIILSPTENLSTPSSSQIFILYPFVVSRPIRTPAVTCSTTWNSVHILTVVAERRSSLRVTVFRSRMGKTTNPMTSVVFRPIPSNLDCRGDVYMEYSEGTMSL